jgi:CTP synthase
MRRLNLSAWEKLVATIKAPKAKHIRIAVVGKYLATGEYQLKDSYAALIDAIHHAGYGRKTDIDILWVDAEKVQRFDTDRKGASNEELGALFPDVSGIIVPIGWGERGVEGMIRAIQYAREEKIPYLGLCYGMQLAVVEFARHVLHLATANSQEVDPNSPHQVVHMIPEQKRVLENRAYGGTMRLGSWDCVVKPGTLSFQAYKEYHQFIDERKGLTAERHRHRYEVNDEFVPELESGGLIIAGRSVKENLVELAELPTTIHPFFVGTQGHPEYKSEPLKPHALFLAFTEAAEKYAVDHR